MTEKELSPNAPRIRMPAGKLLQPYSEIGSIFKHRFNVFHDSDIGGLIIRLLTLLFESQAHLTQTLTFRLRTASEQTPQLHMG